MKEETTNEKLILKAAEEEFLLKGYSGAKTTSIAEKAGVTHAMLHYYYRTKENLFQKVFQEKIHMVASSFEAALEENLPFELVVRSFAERHFDFVVQNGQWIYFVFNEVRANKENSAILRNVLLSKMKYVFNRFGELMEKEVLKGTIRMINPIELLMNIISLNLSSFLFLVLSQETGLIPNSELDENFLKRRRESNVQYILSSLHI